MPRILITPTTLKGIEGNYLTLLRQAGMEIVTPPEPWDHQLREEEILEQLKGIDATIAGMEPYNAKVLAAHPQLKVIARVGVGYDAVDMPAATKQGVVVTITAGANHDTVAEHAFSLLFALAKQVVVDDRTVRQGKWIRHVTIPIRGQTLGIVGLGRIGVAMMHRAVAFGMKVIAYEINPDPMWMAREGKGKVTLVSLDELLKHSDVVSLHAPATPETKHMINEKTLAMMKPNAFLINTARGGLVDEPALVAALKANKIAGAGLDVFAQEPPPQDHAFFALDNVVMTPHTGGTDLQSRLDMAEFAARSIVELSQGKWPGHLIVNREVKERFTW